MVAVAKHCRRPLQRPLRSHAGGGAQWVRNEDRGGRRGRGRSRHIAILGEIGGSEVEVDRYADRYNNYNTKEMTATRLVISRRQTRRSGFLFWH